MDVDNLSTLHDLQHFELAVFDRCDRQHEPGAKELLAALQHLTGLKHLELYHCGLHPDTSQPHQQGDIYQCFSALTASTQLTQLNLTEWVYPPIPSATFQHVFPPGRLLPNLKVLKMCATDPWYHHEGPAQVAVIAASCPALRDMSLCNVTQQYFDVSCLLQLPPGVTRVGGLNWSRPQAGPKAAVSWASLVGSWLGGWAELLSKLPFLRSPS
jgi:hypothetical protein